MDSWHQKTEIKIDKPTVVYLFSDGYKDQFGGKENSKFLNKNLHKLLLDIHSLPMHEQKSILEMTINEWKGTHEQTDDILVMGVEAGMTVGLKNLWQSIFVLALIVSVIGQ